MSGEQLAGIFPSVLKTVAQDPLPYVPLPRPSAYYTPPGFVLLKSPKKCGCGSMVHVLHRRRGICYACAVRSGMVFEESEVQLRPAPSPKVPPMSEDEIAKRIEKARELRAEAGEGVSIMDALEQAMDGSGAKRRKDYAKPLPRCEGKIERPQMENVT